MFRKINLEGYYAIIIANEPTEEFHKIAKVAQLDKDHLLAKNYSNLQIDDFVLYMVLTYKNYPIGFQCAMNKDIYGDATRILSKFYIDRYYRGVTNLKILGAASTKLYYNDFRNLCKRYMFCSREIKRDVEQNYNQVMSMVKMMNNFLQTDLLQCDKLLYQVGQNSSLAKSWQHIIYYKNEKPKLNTMSGYKWRLIFDK